jgi:sterol desaturase/sphingolipid hydroxylase (fatty acid hydroxylase superfamily)
MVRMIGAAPLLLLGKSLFLLAWLAALFAAERLHPAAVPAPWPAGEPGRRLGRNLGLWLINSGLSLLVVAPLTVAAAGHALPWRPGWWSGAGGLAADLLLLDLLIYAWHRLNHEMPLLWRFHVVHHLDRSLDTTSALRFHFGEVLLSALARAAAILLLGLPLTSVLVFETLLLAAAIFHHSNLRLPARLEAALARLVITPSIHWVHHRPRRADTDANYGTVFSFWDRLFGTMSPTRRQPDQPIGAEGLPELPLSGLLLRPFRTQ